MIRVRNWADTYAPLLDAETLRPFLDAKAQPQYIKDKAPQPGTVLLVAEHNSGEVFGFALAFADAKPEPWMEWLHVLSDARGQSAGTSLMTATPSVAGGTCRC